MRRALALALTLTLVALAVPVQAQDKAMHHATGTFVVAMTPEAQAPAPAGGQPTARMGIVKTFAGGLVGTSTATMLSAGTPQPGHAAAYVAIEQVTGTLDGRHGGFLLLHQGTMSSAGNKLSVVVAPDSGSGALAGIAGTLSIEITGSVHHYDLAYTLPAAP